MAKQGLFLALSSTENSITAVNSAFLQRKWEVLTVERNSITGVSNHEGVDAKLTIYVDGNNLLYNCECIKRVKGRKHPVTGRSQRVIDPYIPTHWIESLRLDTKLLLGDNLMTEDAYPNESAQQDYADNRYTWLEVSSGFAGDFIGAVVNLKMGNDDYNWAVEIGKYTEFKFLSSTEDSRSGTTADLEMTTVALTKNWNKIRKFGYLEAGIGLAVAKGSWATSCRKKRVSSTLGTHPLSFEGIGSRDVCNISEGVTLGVPLHASAVFGKYAGIGIMAKAFLTKYGSHAGIMIILPFGNFTH